MKADMDNEFLIIAVSNPELATTIGMMIANRFGLIVEKRDGSSYKGYRLYADANKRDAAEIEFMRGYANGIFDTLKSHFR